MPATVESVARAALGDLAVEQTALLHAERWVNDRLAELAGQQRLRSLRRLGELTIPAAITAGTVTVTRGSDVVTGNATAVAAWSIALQGRSIKIGQTWHRISGTQLNENTLTLEQPYSEDSESGAAYTIVARTVALPQDCRTVVSFYHPRLNGEIRTVSLPWLDLTYPDRLYFTGAPGFVADVGIDPVTKRRHVEFYPYSADPELVRFAYYVAPPTLTLFEPLPDTVDQDALTQGVLASVMRWKMARAADAGNVDIAGFWRNEYRAQETKWQMVLQRLLKADVVLEDLHWIMRSTRGAQPRGDIATAYDHVYTTASRP